VILNGVKFRDLENVIQFIYNGEVKVADNDELQGFLQTGELLQIEGLTKSTQSSPQNETEGTTQQQTTLQKSQPAPAPKSSFTKGSHSVNSPSQKSTSFHSQFSKQSHVKIIPQSTPGPVRKRARFSENNATTTPSNYETDTHQHATSKNFRNSFLYLLICFCSAFYV
jgi:DNA mismatch repair ATPase MutL